MKNWKDKQITMRHYDLQAAIYDVQYLDEQNSKIESVLKNMKLNLNEYVLDLGCGTGFLFQQLSEKTGKVVGLDLSKKALQEAKKRMEKTSNVSLVCADADNTPFRDSVFDKIFSITVLQNMPDPAKTVREMKRVCKARCIFALTGLKKKFTLDSFVALLESAQLKVKTLDKDQKLKGFIAICTNRWIKNQAEEKF
jgi:ubiquinone/menaquinone biosynthesis C-methylase UbiE